MTEAPRAEIGFAPALFRGVFRHRLRKLAFRMGYNFSLRKIPQYDRHRRMLNVPHDMEPEFTALYERARAYTLTSVECMYTLYKTVKFISRNDIPGDMVECGIWRGGSSMMIALTLEALGDRSRDIYLYDTYTGMTQPENVDVRSKDGMEQVSRWQAFQRDRLQRMGPCDIAGSPGQYGRHRLSREQAAFCRGRCGDDHTHDRAREYFIAPAGHRLVSLDPPRADPSLSETVAAGRLDYRRLRRL